MPSSELSRHQGFVYMQVKHANTSINVDKSKRISTKQEKGNSKALQELTYFHRCHSTDTEKQNWRTGKKLNWKVNRALAKLSRGEDPTRLHGVFSQNVLDCIHSEMMIDEVILYKFFFISQKSYFRRQALTMEYWLTGIHYIDHVGLRSTETCLPLLPSAGTTGVCHGIHPMIKFLMIMLPKTSQSRFENLLPTDYIYQIIEFKLTLHR